MRRGEGEDSGHEEIAAAVRAIVEPVVADLGLSLFDIQFRREAPGWVLRLIIDSEDSVSVDDCAAVSREVGDLLDVQEVIDHPYHLEVSSPGLDRPLRSEADYVRFRGRKAKVRFDLPAGGQQIVIGRIERMAADRLLLITDRGEEIAIPLDQVTKANLEVEF